MSLLPISLNVSMRYCLVVGYGPVGQRKVKTLLDAGALVRLVCPEELDDPPANVVYHHAAYHPQQLTNCFLVIACAPPEINQQIVADTKRLGILVSSASDPDAGDFILPATKSWDGLTLSISTHGSSPMIARRIRDEVVDKLDTAIADWVKILSELRPGIIANLPPDRRRKLLQELSDPSWVRKIREFGYERIKMEMMQRVDAEMRHPND